MDFVCSISTTTWISLCSCQGFLDSLVFVWLFVCHTLDYTGLHHTSVLFVCSFVRLLGYFGLLLLDFVIPLCGFGFPALCSVLVCYFVLVSLFEFASDLLFCYFVCIVRVCVSFYFACFSAAFSVVTLYVLLVC